MTASRNTALLYGTLSRDKRNVIHNNAVFSDANRNVRSYQKMHLVPFGEYVPMRRLIERVNGKAKLVVDKTSGTNFAVFDFNNTDNDNASSNSKSGQKYVANGKFSSIICFESADSALVGNMVRKGARMIFVLTNDGWFGDSAALPQHYRISRMRAIEYGVPVIQAANTGVSGIIDKHGQTVLNTATNRRTIIKSRVSFSRNPSKYTSLGPWIPYLFCLIFIIFAAFSISSRHSVKIETDAKMM
jgi:apolipoprotein N-acyltransferase